MENLWRRKLRIKQIDPNAWYDIPGFNGVYQINCRSDIRKVAAHGQYKMLHPWTNRSSGKRYAYFQGKPRLVMSLMRITFFGELPKGYVTYHKDGVRSNDELWNIGVTTKKELSARVGRANGGQVKVVKISSDGEIVDFYRSASEAARKNNMNHSTVARYVSGKMKGIYAPDGYVYCRDNGADIAIALRRIKK